MDKTYLIKFKSINKDYEEDTEGNLDALFSDIDFAKEINIKEIDRLKNKRYQNDL